jgi:hypothetical protein
MPECNLSDPVSARETTSYLWNCCSGMTSVERSSAINCKLLWKLPELRLNPSENFCVHADSKKISALSLLPLASLYATMTSFKHQTPCVCSEIVVRSSNECTSECEFQPYIDG